MDADPWLCSWKNHRRRSTQIIMMSSSIRSIWWPYGITLRPTNMAHWTMWLAISVWCLPIVANTTRKARRSLKMPTFWNEHWMKNWRNSPVSMIDAWHQKCEYMFVRDALFWCFWLMFENRRLFFSTALREAESKSHQWTPSCGNCTMLFATTANQKQIVSWRWFLWNYHRRA